MAPNEAPVMHTPFPTAMFVRALLVIPAVLAPVSYAAASVAAILVVLLGSGLWWADRRRADAVVLDLARINEGQVTPERPEMTLASSNPAAGMREPGQLAGDSPVRPRAARPPAPH